MDEEFELVPLTPLRRIERRIERLEEQMKRENTSEFLKEIVDIIKVNQLIVDEVVKSNEALKLEISKLYPKLDSLVVQMQELLNFIKASVFQESLGSEALKPLIKKMDEMINTMKEVSTSTRQVAEKIEIIERRIKKEETKPQLLLQPLQAQPQQGLVVLKKE
jgi:hypothetical protein